MRIQNRGRKSGKMSDRLRNRICLILTVTGLVAVLIFSVFLTEHKKPSCIAGNNQSAYECIETIHISDKGNVRINTDNPESLIRLPGIGERTAGLITEEYQKNGPYFYPEDLLAVKGIGEKKLQKILSDISLSVSEEERIR